MRYQAGIREQEDGQQRDCEEPNRQGAEAEPKKSGWQIGVPRSDVSQTKKWWQLSKGVSAISRPIAPLRSTFYFKYLGTTHHQGGLLRETPTAASGAPQIVNQPPPMVTLKHQSRKTTVLGGSYILLIRLGF